MSGQRTLPSPARLQKLPAQGTVRRTAGSGRLGRYRAPIVGATAVVLVIVAWQLAVVLELVDVSFIAEPTAIGEELVRLFTSGVIFEDLATSGIELAVGLGLAAVVGIGLGLIIGWYRLADEFFEPLVTSLYATPQVALVPVLILWFGIGIGSKIAVVFLMAVFEILVNTRAGVRTVEENVMRAARSFGATDRQLVRTIVLPSAVPFIATGLRLGVGKGLVGVVVGELFAAKAGVGFRLTTAAANLQMTQMYATLVIIAAVGVALTLLLKRVERHFDAWRV
ncbi:MAG: ABC transporter permease subunit [Streptosporangiales bacterium]|nr:ABC transporter permease subunit [Streptosporangiales bacterium]